MKTTLGTLLVTALVAAVFSAHAQTTAFTYQGFLTDSGAPANGTYDLTFTLYDAASGGSAVGASNVVNDLGVTNGLFTVSLNFGSAPFDGSDRWVQVAVRPGASSGDYTNLVMRQPMTAVPYAIVANLLDGLDSSQFLRADISQIVPGFLSFEQPTYIGPPFAVNSTVMVTNLNAEFLEGVSASSFLRNDIDQIVPGLLAFNRPTYIGPPFAVSSTAKVTNLNAEFLNGVSSSNLLRNNADQSVPAFLTFVRPTYIGPPFAVSSTAKVTNLNAEFLNGVSSSNLLRNDTDQSVPAFLTFVRPTFIGPPFGVNSTAKVTNLNAEFLNGVSSSNILRNDADQAVPAFLTFVRPTFIGPPFGVSSTAQVTNLNAEYLNGLRATNFVAKSGDTMNGSLGIGVSPGYQLQLSTDSAGKPNGGSWANSSDARLKKNIEPLTGALEKLRQLRGVRFEWVNPEDHANQHGPQGGFIAQEVERTFPHWITPVPAAEHDRGLTENGKIKSLTLPFEFDALVVEAIKEQQQQIKARDAEIGELKQRLAAVEKLMNRLTVAKEGGGR